MFNGIIFNQGIVQNIEKRLKGINIFVISDLKLTKKDIGVSVSCDGVCLTLITISRNVMEFYLSDETIQRSKFKFLKVKDKINLELPLKYGQKISGHICQGHIDTVGKISNIKKRLFNDFYLFKSPKSLSKLVVYKDFNFFKDLTQKYKNKNKINTKLGKDIITLYNK